MGSGGIFGIGGSDSTANDFRQTTGDAGINIGKGSKSTKLAQPGGTVLDLSQSQLAPTFKGNKGNITINDTQPVLDLASQFASTVRDITNQSSAALSNALQSGTASVQDALSKVSDLGANAQTGGDASRNKIVLYVVLATLALVGAIFYFRK